MNQISIIVPTLNESGNISRLLKRIDDSMRVAGIGYEVLIIDDRSTDGTADIVAKLAVKYPVSLHRKRGQRGKAYSLLQGFKLANHDIICMIDADLQYPPEAIGPMVAMLSDNRVDVILSERRYRGVSRLRQLSTVVFNLVFTRLLFGINYDTQSGLKVFRRHVVTNAQLRPTPWSFDLEFIVRALENGYAILSYTIPFSERHAGEAKVRVVRVAYELAKASLQLRFRSSPRQVRRGYRMNLKLSQKLTMLLAAILTGLLAASLSRPAVVNEQPVNALQTIGAVTDSLSPVVDRLPLQTSVQNPNPAATPLQPASQPTTARAANLQLASQPVNETMSGQPMTADTMPVVASAGGRLVAQTPGQPDAVDNSSQATYPRTSADTTTYTYSEPVADPVFSRQTIYLLAGLATLAVVLSTYLFVRAWRRHHATTTATPKEPQS